MSNLDARKVKMVLTFCVCLGLLNGAFLLIFRSSLHRAFAQTEWYGNYLEARSLLLGPAFILFDTLFVAYGLWWAFKSPSRTATQWMRLAVLAVMIGNILGLLLLLLVKL